MKGNLLNFYLPTEFMNLNIEGRHIGCHGIAVTKELQIQTLKQKDRYIRMKHMGGTSYKSTSLKREEKK